LPATVDQQQSTTTNETMTTEEGPTANKRPLTAESVQEQTSEEVHQVALPLAVAPDATAPIKTTSSSFLKMPFFFDFSNTVGVLHLADQKCVEICVANGQVVDENVMIFPYRSAPSPVEGIIKSDARQWIQGWNAFRESFLGNMGRQDPSSSGVSLAMIPPPLSDSQSSFEYGTEPHQQPPHPTAASSNMANGGPIVANHNTLDQYCMYGTQPALIQRASEILDDMRQSFFSLREYLIFWATKPLMACQPHLRPALVSPNSTKEERVAMSKSIGRRVAAIAMAIQYMITFLASLESRPPTSMPGVPMDSSASSLITAMSPRHVVAISQSRTFGFGIDTTNMTTESSSSSVQSVPSGSTYAMSALVSVSPSAPTTIDIAFDATHLLQHVGVCSLGSQQILPFVSTEPSYYIASSANPGMGILINHQDFSLFVMSWLGQIAHQRHVTVHGPVMTVVNDMRPVNLPMDAFGANQERSEISAPGMLSYFDFLRVLMTDQPGLFHADSVEDYATFSHRLFNGTPVFTTSPFSPAFGTMLPAEVDTPLWGLYKKQQHPMMQMLSLSIFRLVKFIFI